MWYDLALWLIDYERSKLGTSVKFFQIKAGVQENYPWYNIIMSTTVRLVFFNGNAFNSVGQAYHFVPLDGRSTRTAVYMKRYKEGGGCGCRFSRSASTVPPDAAAIRGLLFSLRVNRPIEFWPSKTGERVFNLSGYFKSKFRHSIWAI